MSGQSCVERWDQSRAHYVALDGRVRSVITWIDSSRERALELLRKALGIADANPEYDDETRLLMRERLEELEAPARHRALAQ